MTARVRLTSMKRVHIRLGGETIVDTQSAYKVEEGSLPARYYVPATDVRATLGPSGQSGQSGACPWKGSWRHLDLVRGEVTLANAAWTYVETTPVCDAIRDFVAFYPEKVDAIEVEETDR